MGVVKGAIGLKDNATAVLQGIRKEQTSFRKDVAETRKELTKTWDKQYKAKVDTSAATKRVSTLKSHLQQVPKSIAAIVKVKDLASAKISAIRSKVRTVGATVAAPVVKIRDMASAKISTITSKVRSIAKFVASPLVKLKDKATAKLSPVVGKIKAAGKMVVSPLIKLKDNVSAGLSKIGGKLKSLAKSVAIPVTIAATVASVVLGGAVKGGMQLEQQQVSMEHFIGATNKGMSEADIKKMSSQFSAELRENANKTPFETGEVMAAGSRAVAIASGNTKEAMSLVQLAEDMAAASGGTKSISDAMEALADAKMGETERLKEFGFKVSAEEFDAKGFAGVSGDLNDFFGGAATKLASTGAGLLSTIKGKLKSNFADFGLKVVDKLKPAFDGIIGLIDKASPVLEGFGTKIAEGIGDGIGAVTSFLPSLISGINSVKPMFVGLAQAVAPAITSIVSTVTTMLPSLLPVLKTVMATVVSVISGAAPIVAGLVQGVGTVISTLAPIFNTIFGAIGEKVGSVISFVGARMGFVQEVIATAMPVVSDILTTAWSVISPVMDIAVGAFKMLFGVVQKVFPGVQKVIVSVWNFIKPLVEGIGKVMGAIASGWNFLVDKVTGGDGGEVGTNARGTSNWKGGLTWVGEQGPELVNLPHGTQVMPNRESMAYSKAQQNAGSLQVPTAPKTTQSSIIQQIKQGVTVTIAKIADTIIVREEADIEKIGNAVAKKIVEVAANMA